ncbi:CAP-Gly domain-containing linker protein 1-like isoform X2 [Oscarella lobularis]|uniref:CAP-Gly domain-containing linker protein 1-like isoform X2 n=1 Tax=Oscarella lobularis TaxID=121494 RepID=UPI00331443D5
MEAPLIFANQENLDAFRTPSMSAKKKKKRKSVTFAVSPKLIRTPFTPRANALGRCSTPIASKSSPLKWQALQKKYENLEERYKATLEENERFRATNAKSFGEEYASQKQVLQSVLSQLEEIFPEMSFHCNTPAPGSKKSGKVEDQTFGSFVHFFQDCINRSTASKQRPTDLPKSWTSPLPFPATFEETPSKSTIILSPPSPFKTANDSSSPFLSAAIQIAAPTSHDVSLSLPSFSLPATPQHGNQAPPSTPASQLTAPETRPSEIKRFCHSLQTSISSLLDEDKFPAKRLSFDDNEPVTDESFLTVSSAQADSTKMLSVDVGVAMTPVTLNSVSVATDLVQMSSVAVETDPLPDWEYKARQYQEKLAEAEEKIVTLENELEKLGHHFDDMQTWTNYKDLYFRAVKKAEILESENASYKKFVSSWEEAQQLQAVLEEEMDKLTYSVETLVSAKGALKQDLASERKKTGDLKSQLTIASQDLNVAEGKVASLQQINRHLEESLCDGMVRRCIGDALLQVADMELDKTKAERDEAQKESKQLGQNISQLEIELKTAAEKIEQLTYNMKDMQETRCFIDNERMMATEDLNALQMTRDADLIAIAKSFKQLWTATRHTINWLAVEGGMDKGNQAVALKRQSLLVRGSLVDRVLAGQLVTGAEKWGERVFVSVDHLLEKMQEMEDYLEDVRDLASGKELKEKLEREISEKYEAQKELTKSKRELERTFEKLNETGMILERTEARYKELTELFLNGTGASETRKMKEKKDYYKKQLAELSAVSQHYRDKAEEKIKVLKRNLAKAEKEVKEMDDFIDRIRHILLASLDVIRTCPKLAAILKEMNGIQ